MMRYHGLRWLLFLDLFEVAAMRVEQCNTSR